VKTASLILANLFILTTCWLMLRNIAKKVTTPSASTFLIRSVVAAMNCFSYLSVVEKNYLELSVTVSSSLSLISIFVFAYRRGRLAKLRKIDYGCGLSALFVGIMWKTTGNPVLANFLLQAVILLAMCPSIIGTIQGHIKERAFPWSLPVASYTFMSFAILWEQDFAECWQRLVHPFTGIIGNGLLVAAALYQNRKARRVV
jgi:hypothetical protein